MDVPLELRVPVAPWEWVSLSAHPMFAHFFPAAWAWPAGPWTAPRLLPGATLLQEGPPYLLSPLLPIGARRRDLHYGVSRGSRTSAGHPRVLRV